MGERTSTVWMVSARTGLQGRKGKLRLEERGLVFQPDSVGYGETAFSLPEIRRAKRVRGSPVLELAVARPNFPPVLGFYFVQPPDLKEKEAPSIFAFFVRRRAKKFALNTLRSANAAKKDEIDRWVRHIEGARAGAG